MPKKVQTPIDNLKWLALAAEQGKYVQRNILTYAYASEEHGQTVTSDGYRLHVVNTVLPNANERGLIELPKSVEVEDWIHYVNYRKGIPATTTETVRVYGHALKKAVQTVMTVSHKMEFARVWLIFTRSLDTGRSNVSIRAKGEVGTSIASVEASFEHVHEATYNTAYNGHYLLDALRGLYVRDDDVVLLELSESGVIATEISYILTLWNADRTRSAIIMPMTYDTAPEITPPDVTRDCPAEIIATRCAPRRYPYTDTSASRTPLPMPRCDDSTPVGYEEITGNRSTCRYGSVYWNFATEHHFAYEHARADRIRRMAYAASAANTGKPEYPWLQE